MYFNLKNLEQTTTLVGPWRGDGKQGADLCPGTKSPPGLLLAAGAVLRRCIDFALLPRVVPVFF